MPRRLPATNLPPYALELLQLLADGTTTAEIAQALGVGVALIEEQLAAAYAQIGARNDVHAVAMATRAGWLRNPGRRTARRQSSLPSSREQQKHHEADRGGRQAHAREGQDEEVGQIHAARLTDWGAHRHPHKSTPGSGPS